jgi:hypothetical protein
LWSRLEPIHAVTYFSPEPLAALADAGYKGFWMGYFAGRAAPMGRVGPEIVLATFYNFSMAHVRRALPDSWTFAPPSAALEARREGSVAALQRAFADRELAESVATAAVLARAAAESAPMEGRTLFAANRALPWPDEPTAALWHAATLLREHRGPCLSLVHPCEVTVRYSSAPVVCSTIPMPKASTPWPSSEGLSQPPICLHPTPGREAPPPIKKSAGAGIAALVARAVPTG